MPLVALKTFVDGQGRRIKPGQTLPTDYDKTTLVHYERLGMIGEPPKTRRAPKPTETKPSAPTETQQTAPKQPELPEA